jgi:hypothetical protein
MLPIFVAFASGAIIAMFYMQTTLSEINRLISLHEIENLRKDLIISLQVVQSDLYTVHTPAGQKLDTIVTHVASLESSAKKCTSCHHEASVHDRLNEVQAKIGAYQRAMSFYITASANNERIDKLRHSAAVIGNDLLLMTGSMSAKASRLIRRKLL